MIFRPRQKTLPITRQIIIENNVLEQVDNTKFLGVYIDQHLTWKTHVNFIAAKISNSVGLLYKAKYYLPSKSLLTLYYAYLSISYLLQFNLGLYLCHQPATNLPTTENRGTQREYSSKPLKHNIIECILVFNR